MGIYISSNASLLLRKKSILRHKGFQIINYHSSNSSKTVGCRLSNLLHFLATPRVQKMAHISWESKGKYFSVGWLYHLDSIHLRASMQFCCEDEIPKAGCRLLRTDSWGHKRGGALWFKQKTLTVPDHRSTQKCRGAILPQASWLPCPPTSIHLLLLWDMDRHPPPHAHRSRLASDMGKGHRTYGIPRSERHHKPGDSQAHYRNLLGL